jgi:SAM-dependent methyltransferase
MKIDVKRFIEVCAQTLPQASSILEIGSYQVDGQVGFADLRPLFPKSKYLGCDMRFGPGVDCIENATNLSFPDGSFDLVLCCELLEHVEDPFKTASEMYRVTSDEGIAIATTQMDFPIHSYPSDYWRFTPEGLDLLYKKFHSRMICSVGYSLHPQSVFIIASKADKRKLFEDIALGLSKAMREVPVESGWFDGFISKRTAHARDFDRQIRIELK